MQALRNKLNATPQIDRNVWLSIFILSWRGANMLKLAAPTHVRSYKRHKLHTCADPNPRRRAHRRGQLLDESTTRSGRLTSSIAVGEGCTAC